MLFQGVAGDSLAATRKRIGTRWRIYSNARKTNSLVLSSSARHCRGSTGGERTGFFTTNMKTYAEKLKDPRWQRKRLEILERDNFTCRHCRSGDKTLHVHHRVYSKGKMPWDYENEILITLCGECHETAEDARFKVSSLMGASQRTDKRIVLLAEAISASPDCLTFFGWALESISRAIECRKIIECQDYPESTNFHEVRDCVREGVGEAVENLYLALFNTPQAELSRFDKLIMEAPES